MTAEALVQPAGLGPRGSAFWAETTSVFELDRDEVELLTEICRVIDVLEEMQAVVAVDGVTSTGAGGQKTAHPLLTEIRGCRLALGRLLGQLALPDEGGEAIPTGRQVRGRAAAAKRWAGHQKERGLGTPA